MIFERCSLFLGRLSLFVEIRLSIKEGVLVTLIYYSNEVTNPTILTRLSETLHTTKLEQYAAPMGYSVVCYNKLPSEIFI